MSSASVSASTRRGWWKTPTRFLPCALLMPVLPPTEESTCASSEVGICTKFMPRRTMPGGKAGEVADDAAAERDDRVAALQPRGQHAVDHLLRVRQSSWSFRRPAA